MVLEPLQKIHMSIMVLMELIKDVLPRGMINVVTSQDEMGAILARNNGIGNIGFMGSTVVIQDLAELLPPLVTCYTACEIPR